MIILQPLAANALSAREVGKIAEGITVLIEYKDIPGNGSGVIIKKEGNVYTILTAAHVVANQNRKYEIVAPDNVRYSLNYSTVKMLPNRIDLAVVTFTSTKNYQVAKIGNSDTSERGTVTYLSGFPAINSAINQPTLNFTEGKISANSNQPFKNGYGLIYSNITVAGMSGGAVLNQNGELVGIHGRADGRDDKLTGNIQKSGLNLGIPINTFVRLSAQAGVNIGVTASPVVATFPAKAEDLLARGVNKNLDGDYAGAIADFTQAINLNPQYTEAFLGRGNARIELKDYQGAINDSSQAIKMNPSDAIAYSNRGTARIKLGDIQGGENDIEISTKLMLQEQKEFQDRMSKIKEDHEYRQRFIEELRREAEKDKNSFN
jgi:S1-C subfamily serine protease